MYGGNGILPLKIEGGDYMLCDGKEHSCDGGGARNALGSVGITIYGGVSGDTDAAVIAVIR